MLYYTLDTKESDMALVEGKRVQVGDSVSFKCDIEQCGTIYKIEGDRLFLESKYGFQGDYIGGQEKTIQSARDCWIEG